MKTSRSKTSPSQSRTVARVVALMSRTDRGQVVRAAVTSVVIGAAMALLGFASRSAVNSLVHPGSGGSWVTPAVLIVVGIGVLMTATWLNYGAVSALSISLGRELDLSLLDAERRRARTEHLDTAEVQKLAATVDEQREYVAGLPASFNAGLTLLAGGIALLVMAVSVSVLLLPLFAGLAAVVWGASLAQRRLGVVVRETALSTRITRSLFALLTAAGPAKDIRTDGAAGLLVEDYANVWNAQDVVLHRARRNGVLIVGAAQLVLVFLFTVALTLTLSRPGQDAGSAVLAFVLAVQAAAIGGTAYPVLAMLGHGLTVYRQFVTLLEVPDREAAERAVPPDPEVSGMMRADGLVLSLREVSVRYPSSDVPAVDRLSMDIRAGSLVAIVGENGSGKSTLASVLLNLRGADQGSVDVFGAHGPRLNVSSVFQDFAQVEATVADGVRFGDKLATDERITDTLTAVGGGEWLGELPDGLATDVGSTSRPGLDLSGGQWQRIALGRGTIAEDLELIVLDEATSALDAHAEQRLIRTQLSQARRHARTGRTAVVLITHRLAAARLADVIHVMSAGRVVESGTHDELIARHGLYARMFSIQADGYR